jgi:rhodanese-related sulfurtransferase
MKFLNYILFSFFLACNANAQITLLDANAFEKDIQDKGVQILDVRTMGEYMRAHIKNALQADWYNQGEFLSRTKHLDSSKPVYVYCQSGVRSHQAAEYLQQKGFKVYDLQGGMGNWQRNGKAVESQIQTKQMDMDSFKQLIHAKGLTLVDFSAKWCAPCIKMKPSLDSLQSLYSEKVHLVQIDGATEIELNRAFQINAFPYFILFKDGQEVSRKQAYFTLKEILDYIKPFE